MEMNDKIYQWEREISSKMKTKTVINQVKNLSSYFDCDFSFVIVLRIKSLIWGFTEGFIN